MKCNQCEHEVAAVNADGRCDNCGRLIEQGARAPRVAAEPVADPAPAEGDRPTENV